MRQRTPPTQRRSRTIRPALHAPLRIAFLAFDDVQVLDVTGPLEVFGRTSRWLREHGRATRERYVLEVISASGCEVRTSSGLRLVADRMLSQGGRSAPIDTLLVAGGLGVRRASQEERVLAWVRAQSKRVRRLASVCTGTFVLAAAGLLDGRRVVTHWSECEQLARQYPRLCVETDPIFIRDGAIYTSAGVTAGMDLALALVEEDCGRDVALAIARELVLFLRRPGGQSQFSAQLATQTAERQPLRELQAWVMDHPGEDLRIPALARRAAMSERNFRRAFTTEVGCAPARFVERIRVEAARRALEDTQDGVDAIATYVGFGTAESMRRAFTRSLNTSPTTYRERFRAAPTRRSQT
jgi:transcriptional regulator GlxA family with amidase domain